MMITNVIKDPPNNKKILVLAITSASIKTTVSIKYNPFSLSNPGIDLRSTLLFIMAMVINMETIEKMLTTRFRSKILPLKKNSVYDTIIIDKTPGKEVAYTKIEYKYLYGLRDLFGFEINFARKIVTIGIVNKAIAISQVY